MRRLLRILSLAAFTGFGLIATTVIFALVVWTFPSLLVRESTLRWGAKLGLTGASLGWKSLFVDAKSISWREKQITLRGDRVCYAAAGGANTSICAKSIDLDFRLVLNTSSGWSIQVANLLALGVEGDVSLLGASTDPPKTKTKESWALPTLPTWLAKIRFERLRVVLDRLRVLSAEESGRVRNEKVLVVMGLFAGNATARGGSAWKLRVDGYEVDRRGKRKVRASASLDSFDTFWAGPHRGRFEVSAELVGNQRFFAAGKVAPKGKSLVDFHVEGGLFRAGANSRLAVDGTISGNRVDATIVGLIRHERGTLKPRNCSVAYAWKNLPERSGDLSLQCPLEMQVPPDFKFSKALGAELRAHLSLGVQWPARGDADGFHGKVELHSDSFLRTAKNFRVDLVNEFGGTFVDFPQSLDVDLHAAIQLGDFASVVRGLRGTRYSVPVPFTDLKGTASMDCKLKGNLGRSALAIPCSVSTRLASAYQKFSIDTEGVLHASVSPPALQRVKWTIRLTDVEAVLPFLSLQAPPRFVPDSRIVVNPKQRELAATADPSQRVKYEIRVIADPSRPVRLHSNLAKRPIPLVADLRMTDKESLTGMLRIASVDVDLFRRQAYLHHMRFRFLPRLDQSEIDGQLRVVYADYTIDISLLGQLGAPEIKLSSSPPLTDREAWAVLLFGKRLESLDDVESSSVGNARSAVADGALSLASMYLLASTPIESIGYDPTKREFEAKLKLADGTSLDIGADNQTLRRLGIRKRLARNWYVTTFVKNPFESIGDQALSTLLEWSVGY